MSESTLGNFMGGILAAMVRADAQAAISTLEFIERIGFEEGARGEDGQIRRLGRMRMVTFDYMRS
ncbi:MAG: hypothetical protein NBV67_17645, partial [Tagaea sp.]|nr:hypothetical protein [Tagaea sp.]